MVEDNSICANYGKTVVVELLTAVTGSNRPYYSKGDCYNVDYGRLFYNRKIAHQLTRKEF
jgi:hypothetical protein